MRRYRNIAVGFVATVLAGLAAHDNRAAAGEIVLYSFKGGGDGSNPDTRPVLDRAGNLYGTTGNGGIRDNGTVFQLTNRRKRVLHFFKGEPDGAGPRGDLIIVNDTGFGAVLVGTTDQGGDHNFGTVFQVASDGTYEVLYSFTGGHDGGTPFGGLVMDQAGTLYGMTSSGGDLSAGTVFALSGSHIKVVHTFTGHDGAFPASSLIIDGRGNLFGTTQIGGMRAGTIFMLTAQDRKMRVLNSFLPSRDGADPTGALLEDREGNLYGTAFDSGPGGAGTVFRLTRRMHELDTIFSFTGRNRFGANPVGGLAGEFCGVTHEGGAALGGTVFQLMPDQGTARLLHSFGNLGDGLFPTAGLFSDASGGLFGTTSQGGEFGNGTVFKATGCTAR